jgi:alpha-beta hydrolase superfamily lysophospholipase
MLRYLVLGWLLLSTASAWAIKPLATYWAKPDTLGLKYQDLTLTTPDHVHLAAWLVAPKADVPAQNTTIVVAGSDSGNMASQIFTAATLAAQGYQVLLFDYRGFGHSDAFAINQNYLYYPEFTTDLRSALAEARRRGPRQRVGVLGFSMGTIMGAEAAATTHCDFLLTVGYVASPQAVAAYYQRTRPERPVLLPAAAATYSRVAANVNCPWLLIAGKEDKVTTLVDSQAVARAAKGPQRRQVLPIPGDHGNSMMVLAGEEQNLPYAQAVSRFLAARPAARKS